MTRFRIFTAIPLAALALSMTVAAGPADATQHGKQPRKHHQSKSRGHRPQKPKKTSAVAFEANPADGVAGVKGSPAEGVAAAEVGPPTIEPAPQADAVALIVKRGPAAVSGLPQPGAGVSAQVVDSGTTGDGSATDEECEQYAEDIATAEWRQFVGETYGSPDLAEQGRQDAADLDEEGTDQGCFFVYE